MYDMVRSNRQIDFHQTCRSHQSGTVTTSDLASQDPGRNKNRDRDKDKGNTIGNIRNKAEVKDKDTGKGEDRHEGKRMDPRAKGLRTEYPSGRGGLRQGKR